MHTHRRKNIKGNNLLKVIYIIYIWKKTKTLNKQSYYDGYYNYYDKIISFIYFSSVCSSLSRLSKTYRNIFCVSASFNCFFTLLTLFLLKGYVVERHSSLSRLYIWSTLVINALTERKKKLAAVLIIINNLLCIKQKCPTFVPVMSAWKLSVLYHSKYLQFFKLLIKQFKEN